MNTRFVLRRPDPPTRPYLDDSQQSVVDHSDGRLLVLAGPGTGKTTTVVETVVDRIQNRGIAPGEVLVLTFSRKAAQELRSRIAARIDRTMATTPAMTFHSFCYALVREHAEQQGWVDPVRLLSAPEQDGVMTELLTGFAASQWPEHIRPALRTRGFVSELTRLLASAHSQGIDMAGLAEIATTSRRPDWFAAARFFDEYLDVTALQNMSDYSDIVLQAARLLADDQLRTDVRARFKLVIVDEYQDTDPLQVSLLKGLVSQGQEFIAVGDPDQSIYGFRGADVSGILDFPREFVAGDKPAEVIALSSTRRFGSSILSATRSILRPMSGVTRLDANVVQSFRNPVSRRSDPGIVQVRTYGSITAEAESIVAALRRAHLVEGLAYTDMAVLVRTSQQLIEFQRALASGHVPVEVAGDEIPLVDEPAVRTLISAVQLAEHIANDQELSPASIIDFLQGPLGRIDATELRRIYRALRRNDADRVGGPLPSTKLLALAVQSRADITMASSADGMTASLETLRKRSDVLHLAADAIRAKQTPEQVLWLIWQGTPWRDELMKASMGEGPGALQADRSLDAICALFDRAVATQAVYGSRTITNLIVELQSQQIPGSTLSDTGTRRPAVRLMTAHRSKGLEFKLVIVAGVQEGGWPNLRYRGSLLDADRLTADGLAPPKAMSVALAEERRLFYVACTRATDRLMVTAVDSAHDDGEQPSRFVTELASSSAVDFSGPHGRADASYTMNGVISSLRRLTETSPSVYVRDQAAKKLAHISTQADTTDPDSGEYARDMAAADPGRWWGVHELTNAEQPITANDEPVQLSGSSVSGILDCPLRWFYSRKARGEPAQTSSQGFGLIIHAVAAAVARGDLPNNVDALIDKLDGVWSRLEYSAPWIKQREHHLAAEAITRFVNWHASNNRTLLAAEHSFVVEFEVDSVPVTLRGFMDRVELDADGRIIVVDLKTSNSPPSDKQVEVHPQLGMYQLAVEHEAAANLAESHNGQEAELVQLKAKRNATEPDKPKVQPQTMIDDDSEAHSQISGAVSTLRNERFWARPSEEVCRTCAFKTACPTQTEGAWIIGGLS